METSGQQDNRRRCDLSTLSTKKKMQSISELAALHRHGALQRLVRPITLKIECLERAEAVRAGFQTAIQPKDWTLHQQHQQLELQRLASIITERIQKKKKNSLI